MGEIQIKFEMNPPNRQKREGQVQATKYPIPTALFLLFMETEKSKEGGLECCGVDRPLPPSPTRIGATAQVRNYRTLS